MKRTAFTLVELLTVIATIVVFMAILLPVLTRSRQEAKTTVCGSNISQLLKGLFDYEAENQIFPNGFDRQPMQNQPAGDFPGDKNFDKTGWWWFNFMEGFYQGTNMTAVCCPSKRLSKSNLQKNILCGNYGINHSICKSTYFRRRGAEFTGGDEFKGTPLRSSNISHPSETLLAVDSGYAIISWWHAADNPPVTLGNILIEDTSYIPGLRINKDRRLWPGMERDAIEGRHPNKTVNVGFVDGHVSRTKANDLLVEKTSDGYKNQSPLWVPK
jgi:prepilin-type processing-associated H-X9-DG protein